MTRSWSIVLAILSIALSLVGCNQAFQSAHEDLTFLVRTVTSVHPMGRTGMPQEFHETIQWAEQELGKDLSPAERVAVLTKVLVSLGDGHTSFHYDVAAGDAIELPLLWLEDGLYVGRGTSMFNVSDRVISIGGLSPDRLLSELRLYIPAENIYWVRVRGEQDLQRETVLRTLGLVNQDNTVTVKYVCIATKETRQVKLPLEPHVQGQQPPRTPERPILGWHIDEEYSLGYFYFDKCNIDDHYRSSLKAFFTAVKDKGVGNIVVDLRNNSGGNSLVTNEFLRYLNVSRYRSYSHVLRIPRVGSIRLNLSKSGQVYRRNKTYTDLAYSGNVFVLTSPQTFSSANWFATVMHDNRLATLVGEPIGNSPSAYGNTLKSYTLPESGLKFSVSMSYFVRPDPSYDPSDSLYPHIHVATTMEDILTGRDPQLDAVKAIIRQRGN